MRNRSTNIVAAACVAGALALLTGCGSKVTHTQGQPTSVATPSASLTPSSATTNAGKDLTPGNCTLYTKTNAVKLLGGVSVNNNAIDIKTDGGKKIDVCSYIDLKSMHDLQGVSYAVVRYDSAATAFAEAKKLRTTMLSSAGEQNWPVNSLTTSAPGAGQVLGGYGTKTMDGVTFTMAVVGTNVGPYLVASLGASTESVGNAKKLALTLFQALSSAVG